jgi:hypothetical protein
MEAGRLIKYFLGGVKDFAAKSTLYFSNFKNDETGSSAASRRECRMFTPAKNQRLPVHGGLYLNQEINHGIVNTQESNSVSEATRACQEGGSNAQTAYADVGR